MTKRDFINKRRNAWRRFAELVKDLNLRRNRLSAEEMAEFSRLFRGACYDLATIRSRNWGTGLESYLNGMVTRAHNAYYSAPPGNLANSFRFVTTEFPRIFRRNIGYFLVAATLFFVPLGVTWTLVRLNPETASRIMSPEQLEQMGKMYEADEDEKDQGWLGYMEGFSNERSGMAGFYIFNNAGIALRVFALGMLMGIGTVWYLVYNGIFIGAAAGYITSLSDAHREKFLSFVVTHGSFELTAIAVSGGAGLILADAILHPGQRTRMEALKVRGREAVQIAIGAAFMLFIAAFIEAFWSPAPLPANVKYAAGATMWLTVFAYLGFAGLDFKKE